MQVQLPVLGCARVDCGDTEKFPTTAALLSDRGILQKSPTTAALFSLSSLCILLSSFNNGVRNCF